MDMDVRLEHCAKVAGSIVVILFGMFMDESWEQYEYLYITEIQLIPF